MFFLDFYDTTMVLFTIFLGYFGFKNTATRALQHFSLYLRCRIPLLSELAISANAMNILILSISLRHNIYGVG
jgi:hypothetical protein